MAHGTVVVLLAGEDEQRSPVGFTVLTLTSVHGLTFAAAAWNSGAPDAGTANDSYSSLPPPH